MKSKGLKFKVELETKLKILIEEYRQAERASQSAGAIAEICAREVIITHLIIQGIPAPDYHVVECLSFRVRDLSNPFDLDQITRAAYLELKKEFDAQETSAEDVSSDEGLH